MKNILSALFSTLQEGHRGGLLLLALMATTCLWAHDFEVNGIYYNYLDDNNVEVTYGGGYSYSGEVTIPATVTYNGTTYSVTSIGEAAFAGCSSLTSVTIGNSVTSIGNDAFGWCSSLISITIPNSVTSIGANAFYSTGIGNDESNWENDVLYIDNCLINAKTSISGAYTIKENTRLIADFAFFGFSSLTSITIPNSVTSIGIYAFRDCSSLTSITIPNSVTSIGYNTFEYCYSLTSITIPNSVTSIGNSAFGWCTSLTSVTIPNSVTSIGNSAFSDCSSLTSITIPSSVTSIGNSAFYSCSSLTSVTIGNSVTSIGNGAFADCSSLTSITIPNSVTSIGDRAFAGCSSLTSIIVEKGNSIYDSRENCNAIIETATNTLIAGCQNTVIPNSVTSIGANAFRGCSSLTSVTIPNSVTSIGGYAFAGCSSLTSITCIGTTPPETYILGVDTSTCTLIVPLPAYNAYLSHAYLGQFLNIVPSSELGSSAPEVYSNPANPTQKLLLDGKIYILRDGKTYTAMGAEIL